MTSDLTRFHEVQEGPAGYVRALAEIRAGAKHSHWIWYIFPQLRELGRSGTARHYGLTPEEARAWLADPVLSTRLLEITLAATDALRRSVPLETLMGSDIDALKLVSCMTLFRGVAEPGSAMACATAEVLVRAEAEGYPPCGVTLKALAG